MLTVSRIFSLTLAISPVLVSAWYKPAVDTSWAIQYSGTYLDVSNPATVYNIDGFNATADLVSGLHAAGHKVICYFSAGSIENYTPDAAKFPASVAGKVLDGWPDEKWLDVRQLSILKPLMLNRAQIAKNKGCDGLDWDNVVGYNNDSGFDLTAADQLAYNIMLSEIAHGLDMAVGLKNDLDQIPDLVSHVDFAVNEQCQQYNECDTLLPFIQAGKPVWAISYAGLKKTTTCSLPNKLGFRMLLKNLDLDAAGYACWQQLTTSSASASSTARSTLTTVSSSIKGTSSSTTPKSISTSASTTKKSSISTSTSTSTKSSTKTTSTTPSTSTSKSSKSTSTSLKITVITSTLVAAQTTTKLLSTSKSSTTTTSATTTSSSSPAAALRRPAFVAVPKKQ